MQRSHAPIVFFGASGHARSLRELMRRTTTLEPLYDVVAHIDDYRGDSGIELDGVPVLSFATWQREMRDIPCAITLGDPLARAHVAERLIRAGAKLPAIYDREELGDVDVGAGSFISAGLRLATGTVIGKFSHAYPFVSTAEGVSIGDYVTLCPHVTLSGNVTIGDRVFVGASAKLHANDGETLRIGSDVRIAAGSVIRTSVERGCRVYGDPARTIRGMHVVA